MTVHYFISASSSVATSYVITGPSSGTVGILSSPFAITPNGNYTGTITITCSDGEGPIVKTWSNSSATQTFALLPMSAGTVTLSISPAPALTGLTSWNYDASGSPVATYTIDGPTSGSGTCGMPRSVYPNYGCYPIYNNAFTVTLGPGHVDGIIRFFPNDHVKNGAFIPSCLALTNTNRTGTFLYSPKTTVDPAITISFNNTAGLTPTNTWTFASLAQPLPPYVFGKGGAYDYGEGCPEAGLVGVQSPTFTWTLGDDTLAGTAVITPSDGAGGTWNPSTISLTQAVRSGTSRLTPATTGPLNISVSNNGLLYDPNPWTFYAGTAGALSVTAVVTTNLTAGESATYTGQVSGGTPPYTYRWNLGDGSVPYRRLNLTHTPLTSGTLKPTLAVTDSTGAVATSTATMVVANAVPTVIIQGQSNGTTRGPMYFGACVTDSFDDFCAGFTYAWTFGDGGTGTGQTPSHQYSAAGSYTVGVVVTDRWGATGSDIMSVTITTPAITTINSAWLATHGPPPYSLNVAGAYYQLAQNVTTPEGAFSVGAANVSLDLNGWTITYDDDTAIPFPNNCFQAGDFTDWDASGAPDASIVAADPLLGWATEVFGDWVCQLDCLVSKTNTIIGPVLTIPTLVNQNTLRFKAFLQSKFIGYPNPLYTGVVNTTIQVIDADTLAVLATATNNLDGNKGLSVGIVPGILTAGRHVRVVASWVPVSGATYKVQMSYFFLNRDGFSNSSHGIISANAPPRNTTIRNGRIVQGRGKSTTSTSLNLQTPWCLVDGVEARSCGPDSTPCDAVGNSWIVRNCTLAGDGVFITNRTAAAALIYALGASGWIDCQYNTFTGMHQGGVTLAPDKTAVTVVGAVINHNTLTIEAHWTNSYAFGLGYGIYNFELAYNNSMPVAGSGIQLDPSTGHVLCGYIHDNFLHSYEPANLEYSQNLNSTALRMRVYYWGSVRDIYFYNNVFETHSDAGAAAQGWGAAIGEGSFMGMDWDSNIVFRQNTFRAYAEVLTSGSTTFTTAGIAFTGDSPLRGMWLDNNIFEGNQSSLAFGDTQSFNIGIADDYFTNNLCRKSTLGAAATYHSIQNRYACDIWYACLLDMRYDQGAAYDFYILASNAKLVPIGWMLDVTVLNADTTPAFGAAVTLTDSANTTWFTGVTSASGVLANVWAPVSIMTQASGANPSTAHLVSLTPLTLRASLAGHTASTTTSPSAHAAVTLTLN